MESLHQTNLDRFQTVLSLHIAFKFPYVYRLELTDSVTIVDDNNLHYVQMIVWTLLLQMMWSKTSLIGCGMQRCDNKPMYVCNYAPA